MLDATDLRRQPAESAAQVGGQAQLQMMQEPTAGCGMRVTVPAGLSGVTEPGTALPFHTHLSLRGTRSLTVMRAGRQVAIQMASSAATPGFTGPNPPLHATTGASG